MKTIGGKHVLLAVAMCAALVTLATPNRAYENPVAAGLRSGTFVGQLNGAIDVVGIAVSPPDARNRRAVRAYVCDSLTEGNAEWYVGVRAGNKVRLRSLTGQSILEVKLGRTEASGSVEFEQGDAFTFTAPPAAGGGGLYRIEVFEDGSMEGVSLAGDVITAVKAAESISAIGDGRPYFITIETAAGETFEYMKYDLSTLSEEELESRGLPTGYAQPDGWPYHVPDQYTAVLLAGERWFLLGRSGGVTIGSPGTRIIGLDYE